MAVVTAATAAEAKEAVVMVRDGKAMAEAVEAAGLEGAAAEAARLEAGMEAESMEAGPMEAVRR